MTTTQKSQKDKSTEVENALKLYFWIEFHKNQEKQWLYLFVPSEAGENEDEIAEYLTRNGRIFDLQSDLEPQCYGAYNWEIVSMQNVSHEFSTYTQFDYEITISPEEQAKVKRKELVLSDISKYKLKAETTHFSDQGELLYNDDLFGEVKVDFKKIHSFMLDKNEVKFEILNEQGEVIMLANSWKVEATGLPPYNRAMADYQLYSKALTPKEMKEETGIFGKHRIGEVSIFIHDEGKNITIVSDEKVVILKAVQFIKKVIQLQEAGKLLDVQKMLEERKS